jgi:hypothetical protein
MQSFVVFTSPGAEFREQAYRATYLLRCVLPASGGMITEIEED